MALTRAKLEELIASAKIAVDFELADITAVSLENGASPTATLTVDELGTHLIFGIPKGDTGETGATGAQGVQGIQGPVFSATFEVDPITGNLTMTTL